MNNPQAHAPYSNNPRKIPLSIEQMQANERDIPPTKRRSITNILYIF